jgi:hypothetical protein
VLDDSDGHVAVDAVSVYVPDCAVVTALSCGFWAVLLNPPGPVQLKLVPLSVTPVSWMFCPAQVGPLLLALAVGLGFTTTDISLLREVWPLAEQVTAATMNEVPTGSPDMETVAPVAPGIVV